MEDVPEPAEVGVAVALEKICTLESRLRQAIQSTHTLHRSFGRDMGAVDREREALLLIREHLELLEDKLREYRTMSLDPKGYDDDRGIALSQLDSLRKDLLRAAKDRVDFVLYNKDVVKDILAFADTGSGDETLPGRDTANPNGAPHSPSLSSVPSEEDDSFTACNADLRENGLHLASSTGVSPYARKDLHVQVDEYQENVFPYPAPASTPSVRAPQARETSRARSEVGANSIPNMRDPSLDFRRQRDASSDLIGASHDYGSHVPKALMQSGLSMPTSLMSSYTDYDLQSARPPSSHVDSCPTPVQEVYSSKYRHDPSFGGKLSLTGFKGREQAQAAVPPVPSCTTVPDRPRIVHDPTYADEQRRLMVVRPEEEIQAAEARSASPIRTALRKRAAAQQLPPALEPDSRTKVLLGVIGSCFKLAVAGIVTVATAVAIKSAVESGERKPRVAPSYTLRPRQKATPDSPGRPRADGSLVPDWMHKPQSRFKSSEWPPTGALTATAGPPTGEMFPVIPPPSSPHAKG